MRVLLPFRTLGAACLLIAGCSSDGSGLLGPVPPELLSSPTTITVDGTPITLGASVIADPRLRLTAVLGATNTAPWPAGASTGRVWVIRNGLAWSAETEPDPLPLPLRVGAIAVIAPPGPSWPVGDSVDVVMEVRDAEGAIQLLRAPRTQIVASFGGD